MKRARFSEEQIIGILKAAESAGNIREVCRENNLTEQTFYRWRRKYGGMEISEAKKLRELERENTELKKMVADILLDNQDAEGTELKKIVSLADRRRGAQYLERSLAVSERRACQVVEIARSTKRGVDPERARSIHNALSIRTTPGATTSSRIRHRMGRHCAFSRSSTSSLDAIFGSSVRDISLRSM